MNEHEPTGAAGTGAEPHGGSTRFRLDIAYDGTAFNGWGAQPGFRTVQGELEGALATILRKYAPHPRLVVAGRTDAGVHAIGQVAQVDLREPQLGSLRRRGGHAGGPTDDGEILARRLNGILGAHSDVVISSASLAPAGFHARFSAIWRSYEYRIADRHATRDPLQRARTTWHPDALDVGAMNAAANGLVGLHDFAAYCKPREGATTIRMLQEFSWRRQDDGVLVGRVVADAFCHNMVRALVGACVAVGSADLPGSRLVELRDAGERTNDFRVMPARGLTMVQVGYPPADELGMRAELTRARRTLDGLTRVAPGS